MLLENYPPEMMSSESPLSNIAGDRYLPPLKVESDAVIVES